MPTENRTAYAVLGVLSFAPMSGYDIKKTFDHSIAHFWKENYGHLYPVLARLEREGLVRPESPAKQARKSGRPARKAYSITPKGREMFMEWVQKPPAAAHLRIEFLLKLFFGNAISPDTVMKFIERERQACKANLEEFAQIEDRVKKQDLPEHRPYSLLCLDYGKAYYSSILEWCGRAEKTVGQIRKNHGG